MSCKDRRKNRLISSPTGMRIAGTVLREEVMQPEYGLVVQRDETRSGPK